MTEYLTFVVEPETFAIDLGRVREIAPYLPVTAIPSAPPCVRGVVNLRGSVLPVVDLAVKVGLAPRPVTRWTCLVVVEASASPRPGEPTPGSRGHEAAPILLGVVTDTVLDLVSLSPEDIRPAPAFGAPLAPEYLVGLGAPPQGSSPKFLLVLDVDRVLDPAALLGEPDAGGELRPRDGRVDVGAREGARGRGP